MNGDTVVLFQVLKLLVKYLSLSDDPLEIDNLSRQGVLLQIFRLYHRTLCKAYKNQKLKTEQSLHRKLFEK